MPCTRSTPTVPSWPRPSPRAGSGSSTRPGPRSPTFPSAATTQARAPSPGPGWPRPSRQQASASGVPLEYGKRLTTAARTGTGVRAFFADGSHADGDILVGADGIHSPVRLAIDPAAPAPRYTGLLIACGYADAATGDAGCYDMIHGRRAFLGHTAGPDGRAWWFARVPGPELTGCELAAPAAWWRDRLAEPFAADSTPAAALIRSTAGPVTVTSAFDIPSLRAWHNDTMVVIGVAAHAASPSTAQGASMALEDAAILARCLRETPAAPEALALFASLRRDRVERIVRAGAGTGNPGRRARRPGHGARAQRNGYSATTSTGTQLPPLRAKPQRLHFCGTDYRQHPLWGVSPTSRFGAMQEPSWRSWFEPRGSRTRLILRVTILARSRGGWCPRAARPTCPRR